MAGTIERGAFFLFISHFVFFITSYVIYFALGRVLGEADFGVYGVIISFIFIILSFLMTAMEQTVSKFVSENPKKHASVKRMAFMLQLSISSLIFLVLIVIAPFIALLLNDPSLTPFIRLIAPLVIVHPLFALFSGALNGFKKFSKQAGLITFYSVAKVVLIVGLVSVFAGIGFGVEAAVLGFIISSGLAALAGILFVGLPKAKPFPPGKIVAFALPIGGLAIIINLILSLDLFAVKALTDPSVANLFAGYYTAAGSIARVVPTLVIAFSSILFPLISGTTSVKDSKKTRFYISNGFRYSLLFIALLSSIFFSAAPETIAFVYGSRYLPAVLSLQILAVAMAFFSVFMLLTTIISASGKVKTVFIMGFSVLALDIILNFALVPEMGLVGAGTATLLASFFGTVVSAVFVAVKFRALISPKTVFRIFVACIALFLASDYIQLTGFMLVFKYFILTLVYFAVLAALRELKNFDFLVFKNLLKK